LIRLDEGGEFTVRINAPTADDYLWTEPDYEAAECVTVQEVYHDPWARYRQVSLKATTPNCRVFLPYQSTEDARFKR
jgi:hypothetical protein